MKKNSNSSNCINRGRESLKSSNANRPKREVTRWKSGRLRNLANETQRVKVRRKKTFRFFLSVSIPPFHETQTHEESAAWSSISKREKELGKWNTANSPMTSWHTFHRSTKVKRIDRFTIRWSDLWLRIPDELYFFQLRRCLPPAIIKRPIFLPAANTPSKYDYCMNKS